MGEEKNMGEGKKELKELEYEGIRHKIRDGDILLYKGQGIISWAIKKFTRSEYSHAGIAVRWNNRLMVMEAVREGVIVNPLRLSVGRYKGSVEWWFCTEGINDHDRLKMIVFAQKKLGKDFAFWLLFYFAFAISFFIRDLNKRDAYRGEKRLFCSLYVAEIYRMGAGLDLRKDLSDRFTSPGDIANSRLLQCGGTLKKPDPRKWHAEPYVPFRNARFAGIADRYPKSWISARLRSLNRERWQQPIREIRSASGGSSPALRLLGRGRPSWERFIEPRGFHRRYG
jgi:hypothetical protein